MSASLPSIAMAQASARTNESATITGTVIDDRGKPVAGALVKLSGPQARTVTSAADGSFALPDLAAGLFRIEVSKSAFTTSSLADIALLPGDKSDVRITLRAASFSSLRQIGSVSASTAGRSTINTGPAAVAVVSATTFSDQGQLSVTRVLNQVPGIVISPPSNNGGVGYLANGSSPLATGIPQIRGALPYETASLIDGHPISIGVYGTFNPVFINPYILSDVEIVKGPGATAPNIDYAIGGTVNFRTLEPTRQPKFSVDSGIDQWGGTFLNTRATGTLQNSGLSYAFDYAMQGTQGYDRGFTTDFAPISFYGPNTVNGVPMCAAGQYPCTFSAAPGNPHFVNGVALNANLVQRDQPIDSSSNERNELAKLRYAFTPTTSLTLSYLGAQQRGALVGGELFSLPITTFVAPPGYTGSFPSHTPIPFDISSSAGGLAETWANLYQAEFRTALNKSTTLLLRYYAAGVQSFDGGPGDAGPTPGTLSLTGPLYGGVPLNSDANFTLFNGQTGTLAVQDQYYASRTYDRLGGVTAEIDKQFGDNVA